MSENTETDLPAKHEPSNERVGDIIRKERITRRIALETIAKDLKLNVKYIKALEANEYNALPADPYIRVYFRTLAKYLMLDPEQILKRFYEERGIPPEAYKQESTLKVSISEMEKERSSTPWLIIFIVIALLAGVSYIANKAGLITTSSTGHLSDTTATSASGADNIARGQARADSVEDSLYGAMIARHDVDSPSKSLAPSAKSARELALSTEVGAAALAKKETAGTDSQKLILEIKSYKDSVWVQVFSDGQSSKTYLRVNQPKKFTAHDSLNVHVGNNAELKYTYNGKPLYIKAKNIAVFKLSKNDSKPEMWNLTKWTSVFKEKL